MMNLYHPARLDALPGGACPVNWLPNSARRFRPVVDKDAQAHVDAIARRLAAAAPDDLRELVLLVAGVHEERDPAGLREAALGVGAGRDADAVVAIVLGFGEIWTVTDDASLDDYVARHAGHLRALLLFELAHEGEATEAMTAAAERAGFVRELWRWDARLEL
jgi:hypothetical protein